MRIAIIGPNPGNDHYNIAVWLRKMGHDLTVYNDSWYISDQPVWHHRNLELPSSHPLLTGYSGPKAITLLHTMEDELQWQNPDWIKRFYDDFSTSNKWSLKEIYNIFHPRFGYRIFRLMLNDYSSKLLTKSYSSLLKMLSDIKEHDVILAAGSCILFAYLSSKPYLVYPYGTEVFPEYVQNKPHKIIPLQNSAAILSYHIHIHEYLTQLGLGQKSHPFQTPVDADLYRPKDLNPNDILPLELARKVQNKFIFFLPSRLDFAEKGTDRVLRAFKRLTKKTDKVFLIVLKRSTEADRAVELAQTIGILDYCTFIPSMLSEPRLADFYNLADVVVDQFSARFTKGGIGGIGRNVLATGKPLLSALNMEAHATIYKEPPPIVSAYDEESIYKSMLDLVESPNYAKEIGKKSRDWAIKYHGENAVRALIELFYKIKD